MRLVVINHITLDGVLQGPGRPGEDTRGGFRHSGWAASYTDDVMLNVLGERMGNPDGGLLLGRWSYEDMLSSWNSQGGPYKDALNSAAKYVVSSNPEAKLQWPNSTLLHGDIPAAVADLKQRASGDLVVMGSGRLFRSLLPHRVIDEYLLLIYPLVLGSGQRLFGNDDHVTELRLIDSVTTTKGVFIATYHPA